MLIRQRGVTLLEILLVIVILSAMTFLAIGYLQSRTQQAQINRATLQLQFFINAATAYYVNNGFWPGVPSSSAGYTCMQGAGASPCNTKYYDSSIRSPWGTTFSTLWRSTSPNIFFFILPVSAGSATTSVAKTIAAKLPMANTTADPVNLTAPCAANATTCYVYVFATMPEQRNNDGAVTFTSLYRNGACVPVPTCPLDKNGNAMTPQILVAPASVTGTFDQNSNNLYPISSFTAYATAQGTGSNTPACNASGTNICYSDVSNGTTLTGNFWRVCLQVQTSRGEVSWGSMGSANSGQNKSILAIIRCVPNNERVGSSFDVFVP